MAYRMSPGWRVSQDGAKLRLYGGADAEYEVELANSSPSRFTLPGGTFAKADLSESDAIIFEQLLLAGVVERATRKRAVLKVALIGDALPMVLPADDRLRVVEKTANADLVLVVRSASSHGEVLANVGYEDLRQPHLYIDVAYHHTASLGPLVFPGETACLGCLYGRLRERWGDEKPPRKPQLASHGAVVAAWIVSELIRFMEGDTSLVGATAALDIMARTMVTHTLLKSSACPHHERYINNGKLMIE